MENNDNKTYQGYLWMSNEDKPRLIYNQGYDFGHQDGEEPFIVESKLWCPDDKTSISIMCIDGKYIVDTVPLSQEDPETMTSESYRPNRRLAAALAALNHGGARMAFKRLWQSQPDEFCEGFNVLVPGKLVFVGFTDKED